MQSTQITLRNVRRSTALSARIRSLAEQLERFHPHVLDCRVSVEQSTQRPQQGRQYQVVVKVRVPGHEIVASHEHEDDLYVALRESFDAARRQLAEAAERERADQRARRALTPEIQT